MIKYVSTSYKTIQNINIQVKKDAKTNFKATFVQPFSPIMFSIPLVPPHAIEQCINWNTRKTRGWHLSITLILVLVHFLTLNLNCNISNTTTSYWYIF